MSSFPKVILYMATSINGFITRGNDDSEWVSETDWKEFDKLKRESGIIVMGSRTYLQFQNDFPQEGAFNVVMTHDTKLLSKNVEEALFTNKTPEEVVEMAGAKGFSQIMLIGGMHLNTSFLKAGLIDEIWLDIHPIIIGEGKRVFENMDIFTNLKMIESRDLGEGQVLVKYAIKK